MKKYTKLDSKTMEVSEEVTQIERYETPSLRAQIVEHQKEIDRMNALLVEAEKLGL